MSIPSFFLHIHPPSSISTHPLIYSSIHLPINLPIHLPNYLFTYLFYPPIYLFTHHIHSSIHLHTHYLDIYSSIYLPIHSSIQLLSIKNYMKPGPIGACITKRIRQIQPCPQGSLSAYRNYGLPKGWNQNHGNKGRKRIKPGVKLAHHM
jgi:hypothetical protein